jgi:hypothetical protein
MRKLVVVVALSLGIGSVSAWADELQQALNGLDDLGLLNSLELDAKQIQQLITFAKAVQAEDKRYDDLRAARTAESAEAWQQARQLLIDGQPIPKDLQDKMDSVVRADAAAREEHDKRVATNVAAIRTVLYPRQNALIDWRTPAEQQRREQTVQRDATNELALRALAMQTIESVRNLPVHQYFFQRLRVAEDFLAPIAPPGSPRYEELYPIVLDIFRRAKEADDMGYLRIRGALADELLQRTGLAEPLPVTMEKPITLDMLIAVFSHPQTLDTLQSMLKARPAAPPGQ